MNFLQKNLIRINPTIIFNKKLFPTIDEDSLEFALKKGLLYEKTENMFEVFENEAYFTQLINKSKTITSKLGEIVAIDIDIKRKLINMLNSSNIKISELPNSILECPGVVKALCNRNIDEVLHFLSSENKKSSLTNSFIASEVKGFIFSNPLENIKYLERCIKIFNGSIWFTGEEVLVLQKACIESNYVISDKSPSFLKSYKIVLNSILNGETPEQINNLKGTTKFFDFSTVTAIENKKIVKAIAKKIKDMRYVYYKGISPKFLISNNEFILSLVENDPYTIEELGTEVLNSIATGNIKGKIVESLKKNNYAFSESVINSLLIDDSDILLDTFDMNFDNFKQIPSVSTKCSNEEKVAFLQREYNIIKEHDPEFSAKTYDIPEYVFESLENTNEGDIQKIIDSVDLIDFDKESREKIFKDINNIDDYNFDGVYLKEDFIKKISNRLLEVNYKVTENTPKFVLMNKKFLINYIKKQKSIENIPEKYVINLFAKEDIIQNNELMEIAQYTVNLKTPLTRYTFVWGMELMLQLYEEFGQFLKLLDPFKKYTVESARTDLIKWMYDNINNLSEDEVYFFYTKLKPEVKEKNFNTYINLCNSDIFMKYAIRQNSRFLYEYNGKNEDLLILAKDLPESDLNQYLLKFNFASSAKLMSSLIKEKSPDFIRYYRGSNVSVVSIAVENGLFDNKNEEYINQILKQAIVICHSDDAIKYLIENYNVNYIEQYTGNNESITQIALDKGYIPTLEKTLNNYNLLNNNIMIQQAIKKDIYFNGLLYNGYSDSEKLEIVRQIIGEETYTKIFKNDNSNNNLAYTNREKVLLNLTSIIQSKEEGVQFLKLIDKDLINETGFEEWKKIVKYSFNNEKIEYLQNVLDKSEIKTLLKFINKISPLIKDDKALGVNKFLTITRFYDLNPVFCKSLLERMENKEGLTDIEIVNLETLIYREDKNGISINASSLKNLIEIEQRQLLEKNISYIEKNKIFTFLFNMSERDISEFLSRTINSRTIAQIRNRAIEEENKKLLLEAEYIGIVIDIIENIMYNYSDKDLKKLLNTLAKVPQSEILKIRKNFCNIPEMARYFYEIEAQEELTDIEAIIKDNPELISEYKGVKIVDLSRKKHTVYAHVYTGNSFEKLFNTEYGKVIMCVSVETDKHEAYYQGYSPDNKVVIFFNKIQNGSYVGSSPYNMGSNWHINNNDYEVKNTEIFHQKSIRELYYQNEHSEILLYRYGLVPGGLIINKVPPSEYQIEKLNRLQEAVRKIKGHESDTLYFIKTQGNRERTVNYEENRSRKKMDADVEKIEDKIRQLRENFFNLVNINQSNNHFIRNIDGEKYTIVDGEVFEEAYLTEKQQENLKLAAKLEEIVHQGAKRSVIKYKIIKNDSKEKLFKGELTDSRTLINLKRKNAHFSEKTIDILLGEFLIDHLMCNYKVGNNDFVLNPYNAIQAKNKNGVLENIEDFISNIGEPHTEMSYYYYDNGNNYGKNANNVYRKIFENYINNPNIDEIISETLFNNMKKAAINISIIQTNKYMEMYKNILNNIDDLDKRVKAEKLIRARKENIIEDTEEFIRVLKNKRKIAQSIEKIESSDTVALISDIHGNASALEEILKKCIEDDKTDVFVLGDIIGFGAESNKCLDILRIKFPKLNIRCILGNHELYSLMGNASFETKLSRKKLEHTAQIRKEISVENKKFLESMPITRKVEIEGKSIEFTHYPIKEDFQNDNEMYLPHGSNLQSSSTDFVIYGHEHRTENTSGNDVGDLYVYNTGNTTFVNLPSSGCVHGENTTYGIINTNNDDLQVSVIPLSYDKEKNDEAIRKTNNPYPRFFGTKNVDIDTR